jgi:hypothetical protein
MKNIKLKFNKDELYVEFFTDDNLTIYDKEFRDYRQEIMRPLYDDYILQDRPSHNPHYLRIDLCQIVDNELDKLTI